MEMMATSKHPSIPVFFFFFIIIIIIANPWFILAHSTSPVHAASKLVEGVCRESQHCSLCIKALGSDGRTQKAKTYKDLAVISISLGIRYAKSSRSYIDHLSKSPETGARKKCALKKCMEAYDSVILSFRSSMKELDEDSLTANYDAKVAGDGPVQCSDALAYAGVKDSSVSHLNHYTSALSEIAFVITLHLPD